MAAYVIPTCRKNSGEKKTMIIITKLNLSTAVIGLTLERYQLQGRVK